MIVGGVQCGPGMWLKLTFICWTQLPTFMIIDQVIVSFRYFKIFTHFAHFWKIDKTYLASGLSFEKTEILF